MKNVLAAVAICSLLLTGGLGLAEEQTGLPEPWTAADQAPDTAQPTSLAPSELPPAPPALPPPAPEVESQPDDEAAAPSAEGEAASGQWVFTGQYGWLFLPYGEQYTSVPVDPEQTSFSYAYQPAGGWVWLASPWVVGVAPYPFFGILGPWRFGWYRDVGHNGHGHPARGGTLTVAAVPVQGATGARPPRAMPASSTHAAPPPRRTSSFTVARPSRPFKEHP